MTVITITRAAICKDCKFCVAIRKGKLKRHNCTNPESKQYTNQITLNDLVCDQWVYKYQ